MIRAIRLTCLSLLILALGGSVAFAKPAIAVLGLEVVDKSGTPTPADTVVATELTSGLRSRAKAGTGPYQLAAGSDKELIDEKLLKNCDDEKPTCMSQIGSELGADFMMYGKIEKQGGAYQVTIVLLDVRRKVKEKTYPDSIPLSEAQGAALQGWAKKIYAKLTGQTDTCIIVVKTSGGADRGTILIDGEEKGNITNGVGQVAGLAEGRYKVAVEVKDFHRWEKSDVTCGAGQTVPLAAELERSSGGGVGPGGMGTTGTDIGQTPGPVSESDTGPWKSVLIGGAIATGVLAVGLIYTRSQVSETGSAPGFFQYGGNCKDDGMGSYTIKAGTSTTVDQCKHAGTYSALTYVTGIGAVLAGGVTLFALIKTVTSHSSEERVASGRVRKPAIVVTPVVGPNGGGATLQFDW